jgi:hypothetical protein
MGENALNHWRGVIEALIIDLASHNPSHGQIESMPVIDRERGHYMFVQAGWDRTKRIHGIVVHIQLVGEKVWIQFDGTDLVIADLLMEAGIPAKNIVLAWHPPAERKYTEFAQG